MGAHDVCELLWLKIILGDLKVRWDEPMRLYCDNKSTTSIAHNPVQHDQTKHIEIDRHFIKEKLDSGLIHTLRSYKGSTSIYFNEGASKHRIPSNYK